MRDERQTGYAPILVAGVTAEQRVTVQDRVIACDGEIAEPGLGHPRIFLRIVGREITCPYCSITYVLAEGAGGHGDH